MRTDSLKISCATFVLYLLCRCTPTITDKGHRVPFGFCRSVCVSLFASCCFLFSLGCASQWSLRTEQPETALQWYKPAAGVDIEYVSSLKGFRETNAARAVLRAVVYGDSEAAEESFDLPVAVAVGRDGRIAVADTGRNCVYLYVPHENRYLKLLHSGDELFKSPVAVIFDDDLRLYVSDSLLGSISVFGEDGLFRFSITQAGSGSLKRPTGLAYSSSNKFLYAVDTQENSVYAFDSEGTFRFSFGSRGEENGKFNYPTHIFLAHHMLYITDSMNFRAEIFDETGRFIDSFGRHGDAAGEIAMPKGIAADNSGAIYLVDALFDNVQVFDRKGQFLMAIGGGGTQPGEFWLPAGLFIDETGKLYVCDPYNHRIQIFQIRKKM